MSLAPSSVLREVKLFLTKTVQLTMALQSLSKIYFSTFPLEETLKSDNVEMKHILDEFHRVAIANEHCSFYLFQNNKEITIFQNQY